MEAVLGVSRRGPLPAFSGRTFRSRHAEKIANSPPSASSDIVRQQVAYFHGCSTEYYEPWIGELAVAILERLDCQVTLPPQGCCGLPLQSNGLFAAARRYARSNVDWLAPFAAAGVPIVGTSTSCTLALKHEYRAILDLQGEDVERVAAAVFDIFEFIAFHRNEQLARRGLQPVPLTVLYHPPCQLRAHGIGTPAIEVLRRIPDLEIIFSEAECCGIAGTYGLKRERATIASDVGRLLFDQARQVEPDMVLTDSETCRWWIQKHTGIRSVHPLQILARAMDIA
jgi:glycerol-3-phosphate dehydrogenase subunit C